MTTRSHPARSDLPRRVAASAGAVALVLGPPLALWSLVGNPLPAAFPSVTEIGDALTAGRVAERTLLKALALVCWAAWAQIVVALAVEVVAVIGERPPPRVPVLRAFRSLGVVVVAGIWLSASNDTAAAEPLPPLPTADAVGDRPSVEHGRADADVRPPPGTDASGTREYVVARRDSLWSIAEAELGDPLRWPEILELNRGRPQPDGGRLESPGDSIRPGWVLDLPGEAGPGTITVEAGDTLWGLAGEHLGDGHRWQEIFAANGPSADGPITDPDLIEPGWSLALPTPQPAGPPSGTESAGTTASRSGDPLVSDADAADAEARAALERLRELAGSDESPGEVPAEPEPTRETAPEPVPEPDPAVPPEAAPDDPLPAPPEAGDAPVGALTLPAPETWPDRRDPPSADVDDPADAEDLEGLEGLENLENLEDLAFETRPGSATGALAGAGIFAAGVAWTLTRLRRAQERWRNADAPVEPVDAAATEVEVGLRQAADADLMEFLDRVLRTFSQRLHEANRVPPPVVGVNVADELSILFAKPDTDAPEGFAAEDDGFSWVVGRDADLPDEPGADNPLPALFTVGHTDHSQVLLNPEAAGSIAVRGASLDVQEALFTMAVELATGPWAGSLRVVCVGFGHELSDLDHVEVVNTPGEVVPVLEEAADVATRMCETHAVAGAVDARISRVGGDASEPIVVLCAAHAPVPEVERVLEIAHRSPGCGVTAIVAGNYATAWQLDVSGDQVELLPMRVTLARHHLDQGQRQALGRLLEKAARIRALNVAPRSRPAAPPDLPTPALVDDEPAVEVRVLGPVGVEGRAADFRRRKPLELVVYLALHRRGVEGDVLTEALWPDRFVAPATLHSTTSLARRCLGADPSGAPYLPHASTDGLYRVSEALSLDYDRFRAYVARARQHDGPGARDRAIADLGTALALVRGRPFSATGSEYLWTHGEALVTAIIAEITDTAHELACLYLDANDHRGAWWATQQGLLASPGNEQLHRDRMLAADLAGNPVGVEDVMEELCRAIEIDGDEIHDVLHPQTLEVYEQLTRRPRSRA